MPFFLLLGTDNRVTFDIIAKVLGFFASVVAGLVAWSAVASVDAHHTCDESSDDGCLFVEGTPANLTLAGFWLAGVASIVWVLLVVNLSLGSESTGADGSRLGHYHQWNTSFAILIGVLAVSVGAMTVAVSDGDGGAEARNVGISTIVLGILCTVFSVVYWIFTVKAKMSTSFSRALWASMMKYWKSKTSPEASTEASSPEASTVAATVAASPSTNVRRPAFQPMPTIHSGVSMS